MDLQNICTRHQTDPNICGPFSPFSHTHSPLLAVFVCEVDFIEDSAVMKEVFTFQTYNILRHNITCSCSPKFPSCPRTLAGCLSSRLPIWTRVHQWKKGGFHFTGLILLGRYLQGNKTIFLSITLVSWHAIILL